MTKVVALETAKTGVTCNGRFSSAYKLKFNQLKLFI